MNLAAFDLNLLKVLDALLIEGSTTRAASRVGLSQPAVSAALGRLRTALNDPLFVREGAALRPTEFATALREPIRAHLSGLEQTLAGAGPFDPAECDASFRISGSDYFSVMLLPALMQRLGKLAPNMRLSFVDLVHPGNLHEMGRMDVDIALPCTHNIPSKIAAEPMFWSAWQVVARVDHPRLLRSDIGEGDDIPIDLYCDMDHVVFSSEGRHASYEDQVLSTLGRSRRVALSVGSFRDLYETVAGSDLLAVLPGTLARAVARRFRLTTHPVPFSMEPALLWVAWNRWQTDDPAHRWLRGEIANLLRHLKDVDRSLPNSTEDCNASVRAAE
ncbi:LysR family transcriptional regulator [Ruegeria atlantica]|uniref:HTH-type transcriptional regulator LeuO n=1 Tax=Ruegeria atlantica TaxID=81569 RepID=A0A0P1ECR6_9RHOB|nr:LysR family transcriptional regulator [Ruegeria atlantica]CUH47014.1 HTH-type transcriptional regulator LeuO [Ruegeria atlantica]